MVGGDQIYAGVELGGTKCICILARGPDDILAREVVPTGTATTTLIEIGAILKGWRSKYQIASLGIASFGPLELDRSSPRYGQLTSTPKGGWPGADLLQLSGGLPLAVDTDVNGAALAEGFWGAATALRAWCYITIGTGVGVGTVIDGSPIHGMGHTETGHMLIPATGSWLGNCPYHGNCVEGLVSGPALSARTGMPSCDIPDNHPVWDDVAKEIAWLCHNLVFTVVPQRIVFGGGIIQRRPHLLPRIRDNLRSSLASYAYGEDVGGQVDNFLVGAELGDDAGPLGAVALAATAKTL